MSYQIKAGDTLSKIARNLGVSVNDLVKANPQIKNPDHIETGWTLQLPMPKDMPGTQDGFATNTMKPALPNLLSGASNNAETAQVQKTDVPTLTAAATKAEAQVMSQATQLAGTKDPQQAQALLGQLKGSYGQWQKAVSALVAQGQLDSPQVKSFAQKTEQARVLQTNIPAETKALNGAAYNDAVQGQIGKDCLACKGQTVANVIKGNPLMAVPGLSTSMSVQSAAAKGIATTEVNIEGKTGMARKDVVMVFAPGVVRTGKEFTDMRQQALLDGIASTRAETGTFVDPDENAKAIATAIKQAKDMVGNPNAKVILVGYSQGNTNVYAFMRDKNNLYGNLTKDVVGIHDIHSAAKGSQLADLAYAMGDYLTTDKKLSPEQEKLVDAYCEAQAKTLHLPEGSSKAFRLGLTGLHDAFKGAREGIHLLDKFAGPVMQKLGFHGLSDQDLNKKFLSMAMKGTQLDTELAKLGAPGQMVAKALQPLLNTLKKGPAPWLLDPAMSPLVTQYINGGLESLTTDYGNKLMTDPKLQANLKNVAILNSVGAIPQDRETELVPNSQKMLYNFFGALGMENDYEVSLPNQRLADVVPHAVDLPPDSIGHWGVTGVTVPVDHPEKYFASWSPPGMTNAVLNTFHQMGVIP